MMDADYFDAAELRAQDLHERRYRSALLRHQDCRDPDHPGCEHCEEDCESED